MPENSYRYFFNDKCKYYPCHSISGNSGYYNCMFCYCPLYCFGKHCGGNFKYLENGIKDCSNCLIPHSPGGYDYITGKYHELADLMSEMGKLEDKIKDNGQND